MKVLFGLSSPVYSSGSRTWSPSFRKLLLHIFSVCVVMPPSLPASFPGPVNVCVWDSWKQSRDETPFLSDSRGVDVSLKIGSNHGHCLKERVGPRVWGSEAQRSRGLLFVYVSKLFFSLGEKLEKWCKACFRQKVIFIDLEVSQYIFRWEKKRTQVSSGFKFCIKWLS